MDLKIGTDIVEIDTIKKSIQITGNKFLKRVYSSEEISFCESQIKKYQYYSGLFAAKEAFMKAIGRGWLQGIKWNQIQFFCDNGNFQIKPDKYLSSFYDYKVSKTHVSISFCEKIAIANILIES